MAGNVGRSYDKVAEVYATQFADDLINDREAQRWLGRFAGYLDPTSGPVGDLGCGPGTGLAALTGLGFSAFGIDISAGQLAQAQASVPTAVLMRADLACLPLGDQCLGGAFARYSIIHGEPVSLSAAFSEWHRVLAPGAPALVTFFSSQRAEDHGQAFDHRVTTAYELWPEAIGQTFADAGFVDVEIGTTAPPSGGRPFGQGTVLARRPPNRR